ncbi:DMT family transporter [Stappia taiwanensis]|uniref:DMT family transporter n=1 Tax=Stappia taiwanensis TaxID=992267 RepID=A0A838XPU5_9HYPH|nr:DMT family transporter [Stappia taiwanensis]MBA4611817.1 DMT family transporter [Stappia taiwanensis]
MSGTGTSAASGPGMAHLAMLGFVFLVSTSFPVGHAITAALDPAALNALRFTLAAVLFAGVATAKGSWHWPRLSRLPVYLLIAGALDVFFVTMFEALRLTSALNAGAIFTLLPAFTCLAGYLLLRQTISRFQVLCLLVGAIGALLVLFGNDLSQLASLSLGDGERIFLIGVVAYAFYAPLMRRFNRGEPLESFNFWILVTAALLLCAYAAPQMLATDWRAVPAPVYLGIVYLAVFPTAASFFLASYASLRLPSGPVMAYTYLLPSFVLAETQLLGAPFPGVPVFLGVVTSAAATLLLQRDLR